MRLFYVRFKDYETNRYCLVDDRIPDGYFYSIYCAFTSENLAYEYIRRNCKISRILTPDKFVVESIDLPANPRTNPFIYQVGAWIHEDNDNPYGYFYSYPYASAYEAQNDKLWLDAVDTIMHNNKDRRYPNLKNYYDNPEDNHFLRSIGCLHPFFESLDGTKKWIKYEAYIRKICIIETEEDIGKEYEYLKDA